MKKEQRLELERQLTEEYLEMLRQLEGLEPYMNRGDEEATRQWLDQASNLIDGFRETRALFPSDGVGGAYAALT